MSVDFLLEIGTEEIPSWMIPNALQQLSRIAEFLGHEVETDATPRRLVARAQGWPERQADHTKTSLGPPKSAGERAAAGFAKKNGVSVDRLHFTQTGQGEYYAFRQLIAGRMYRDLLAEALPNLILSLQWPKTMYWTGGKTGPRFIRPIRWIVALLGNEVIPFEVAGVASSNVTRGHRMLGNASIPVTFANYESELRKNGVILSADERRKKIEAEAAMLGATVEPELRETLTYITEFPTAIRGDFNPAYLDLPAEVLITVMKHHQKYFAVEAGAGKLAPHFVAVLNTNDDPEGLVKHGNERVLKARFNDARFFWDVDQQKKLIDRVADLEKVTFQAKLGSYKAKTDRVVALVKELGGDESAQRAALLAKTDLTTDMVKEFTDLQGVVGGLYARAQGETEPVAKAIYDHYKPLHMEDSIPSTREGQIVALADKLDTLRGCFAIGLIPSGSKDPFALRRAAQGVVKILVEAKLDYTLDLIASGPLREFLLDRIQYYFREVRGFKYDEVNAVLKVGVTTLADAEDRLLQIARVRPTPNFEPLAAAFKRINNILKQANFDKGTVQADLLEAGPEGELYEAYERLAKGSLETAAELRPYVDRFFDKVMVNVPDEKIRTNRLSMLSDMLRKFSTVADFSEIVTSGEQKS